MTVLDSSGAIDYLLATGAADEVAELFRREPVLAAPDLLVFEVLAVLRRDVLRGSLELGRASRAIDDLGDLAIDVFETLPLRGRAWDLHPNLTAADAVFVALAEALDEPLATKDRGLADAARRVAGISVIELGL